MTTAVAGGRAGAAALLAAAVLLVSGCRADVDVGVDVEPDGAGEVAVTVAVDEEVLEQAPDLLDALELADLADAGWEVAEPRVDDGRAVLRAAKPFAGPEAADAVLDELTGRDGAFAGLELVRESSATETVHRLEGEVDLTAGMEAFGGPRLRELLGGSSVGLDPEELERRAGAPLAEVVRFHLAARLPGEEVDGAASWRPVLGEVTPVSATSRLEHADRLRWAGGSVAAMIALSVVMGYRWLRSRGSA